MQTLAAAPLALLTLLPQSARDTVRGVATLEDARPWANATVLAISRPVAADERFGEADRIRATTDEAGRFALRVLPGRHYTVWAHESDGESGYRVSAVIEGATRGRSIRLAASKQKRDRVRVRLIGAAPWRKRSRLTFRALSDRQTRTLLMGAVAPVKGDPDTLALPTMPGDHVGLEILADGMPLTAWPRRISLRSQKIQQIKLAPPRAVFLRFLDKSTRKPIAGAKFWVSSLDNRRYERSLFHHAVTSDEDGYAIATLPIGRQRDFSWANFPAHVTAPGYAPLGWIHSFKVPKSHDGDAARKAGKPAHVFELDRGLEVRATLFWRNGKPAAGLNLCVHTQVQGAGGPSLRRTRWPLRTDEGGKFSVWVHRFFETTITAHPDATALSRLSSQPTPLCPKLVVAHLRRRTPPPKANLGHILLDELIAVELRVATEDGSPSRFARVTLGTKNGAMTTTLLGPVATDRLGRARVLLPAIRDLTIAAWDGNGAGMRVVDATTQHDSPVRVVLEKTRALPGRVGDKKGRPVADATVAFFVYSASGKLQPIASAMNPILVRTNEAGEFSLPLYDGVRYQLSSVRSRRGESNPGGVDPFTAGRGDQPDRIDLVIDP